MHKIEEMKSICEEYHVNVIQFDTESEMDNNLELNEKGYEEFCEAYFEIIEVVKDDTNSYSVGQLIAINYHCLPNSYRLAD